MEALVRSLAVLVVLAAALGSPALAFANDTAGLNNEIGQSRTVLTAGPTSAANTATASERPDVHAETSVYCAPTDCFGKPSSCQAHGCFALIEPPAHVSTPPLPAGGPVVVSSQVGIVLVIEIGPPRRLL